MNDPLTSKGRLGQPLLIGAATGLVYGIILRASAEAVRPFMSVMTLAFLFVVPVVLGYLTVQPHLVFFFFFGWEGAHGSP